MQNIMSRMANPFMDHSAMFAFVSFYSSFFLIFLVFWIKKSDEINNQKKETIKKRLKDDLEFVKTNLFGKMFTIRIKLQNLVPEIYRLVKGFWFFFKIFFIFIL